MPLVKTRPMRFRPRSLADTLDGNNEAEGACSALINLIQDPSTPSCLQCRPAAQILSTFPGFNAPGITSQAFEVNNLVYGFIASSRNIGHDEPFVYNLTTGAFLVVNGITAVNSPITQPSTGDWVPPSFAVVGTKIIATHPGFAGLGNANVIGYFDVSNYTQTQLGNVTSGSNQITGNMSIGALGPGFTISGTGIAAGATVTNLVNVTPQATGTTTASSPTLTAMSSVAGFAPGQPIAGVNIPLGATIVSLTSNTITMSANALATSSSPVTVSATGTVVTMSANATGTGVQENVVIAGGTANTPLWCAGNTTNIQLAGIPTNISNFNNRAYISVGQYLTLCDPLSLNISQATQTLVVGDTSPITALQPLTIINPATSAPVQGLLAFKANLVTLVTGDPTTNNLANNTLSPSGVGTTSPDAVCATTSGVYFVDVDGLRCVELSGNITDPLPDVRVPFINAINRTRISAAYNAGVYRVCLQRGDVSGTPWQEFWFDLKYRLWTGPHTFQQQIILPWKGSFIAFSNAFPATIYQTDPVQTAISNFIENGTLLSWTYATAALPDNEDLMYNSLIVASINVAFKAGAPTLQVVATDENGTIVGLASIITPGAASFWGSMVWGTNVWYGQQYGLQPRQIPWTAAVVFSKLILKITAPSSLGFQISNFQALYQPLGYVNTPVGVAVNNVPVNPPPPVSFLWDAGYLWDTVGLNWQG